MKKTHVIAIVIIALSVGAILSAISDSSTYANFDEAFSNPGKKFHVVGELNREKGTIYEPEDNPDLFVFYMIDKNGMEKKVHLNRAKPQDFERSEQIVIIGKAEGEDFAASDILLKCPSKYTDGTPQPAEV